MPPARAWELSAANHGITWLDRPERIDAFVGQAFRRRLTRNGLQLSGHWFRDRRIVGRLADDLAGMGSPRDNRKGTFAAWVKVKLNPEDMSVCHVWNPRTREYVAVPSATPQYAEGLTLYQHRQIRRWAKEQGRLFSTEEEQLAARQELNDLILKLVPDVALRERAAMARMLGSEAVQRYQPSAEVVDAEPRWDGMGPVIPLAAGADHRGDGEVLTGRPARKPNTAHTPSPVVTALAEAAATAGDPYDLWDDDETDVDVVEMEVFA